MTAHKHEVAPDLERAVERIVDGACDAIMAGTHGRYDGLTQQQHLDTFFPQQIERVLREAQAEAWSRGVDDACFNKTLKNPYQ